MQLYKNVFRQAWQQTLHRPALWVLGFFATIAVGTAGELDRYLRYLNALLTVGHPLNIDSWRHLDWFIPLMRWVNLLQTGNVKIWIFTIGLVVALALVVMMIVISYGGLVTAATHQRAISYAVAWRSGWEHSWAVAVILGIRVITIILSTVLLSASVTHLADWLPFDSAWLVAVMTACVVLLPIIFTVSVVCRYATQAVIINNLHVWSALRLGWKTFWQHWLVSLEMSLIHFGLAVVASLTIVGLAILSVIPYLLSITSFKGESVTSQLYNGAFLGAVVYVLGMIIFTAIFNAWQIQAWTLLFQRLLQDKPTATLLRVFK